MNPSINAHELAAQLHSQRVAVIDVREPMEYASGHIAGSLNVPLARLHQSDLPRGPLVLVCQSGNRSSKGVQTLLQQGHPDPVSDLAGGLPSWSKPDCPCAGSRTPPCR